MANHKKKVTDEAILAALNANPGLAHRKVGAGLGMCYSAFRERLYALEQDGRYKRPEYQAPPAMALNATSTLRDADGNLVLQWTKESVAGRSPVQWAETIKEVFASVNRVPKIAAPEHSLKDLLTVYPIGDHHTAMYAWAEEAGADYDIKLAERLLVAAASYLVDVAPPSDTAMIVNVGDFFHVDQHRPETSRSHNALDVDTRYAEMIRAGVKMLRTVIEHALKKHRNVIVVNACGNHDDIGALWLSLTLGLLYEGNKRLKVEQSASKFTYHQHGKVLIGVTHGDSTKLDKLGGVMATDRPEMWGATEHRYWFTGHIHQRKVLELPGCMAESFRTLAARDAWATAAGYRSGRDMTAIVLHKEHGEVARHRFDVSMLEGQ